MLDLYNNKYDRKTLKENIYAVKLIDILKTQTIDITFVVKYILNKKYQLNDEDKLESHDIVKYQSHISYEQLHKALLNYDSDNDSIDDFETIANKDNK